MPYKDPLDPRARAARLRHYYANKQPYLDRARAAKETMRQYLEDLKARTPCSDCGVQYPYWVMQFDHREDEEKLNNVGNLAGSWNAVLAEVEKCDVVCANCHCERTHNRRVAAGRNVVSKTTEPGS